MEVRENLLRFVNLVSMNLKQSKPEKAARRQVWGGIQSVYRLLSVTTLVASAAYSQVGVPRYQSPLEAPRPQLNLPAPPPATTVNGTMVEYQIVRVNDRIIDNSDYERAAHQLIAEAQQANIGPAELEQRQKDMLRDMIDQQLLLSRGKELDINADSEVIRRLDEIRKQNHLDSMEALEKAVRDSGVSFEDFKSNIKNSVISQEVVRDEVGRNLRLSTKEEQAYYEQHKQDFAKPEQVRLSEILIPTPEDATDAQIAQAKAKADMVASKLKEGATFDDLAKQYSGGPNPESGGDLGTFKRGDLAKLLEDQTFPLKTGESTAPIRTRQGFVLLKVTDHIPAGIQPLSAVEEQVQEAIYSQAIQPALRAYLTKLRENAFIDIAPGYVDTGASPKETKPVFAGATPLPTKKKKTQQKARLENSRPAAPSTAASPTPAVSTPASPSTGSTASARSVAASTSKKRKKIKREKIRFGQAPRNSLPSAPEETLMNGADQGPGGAPAAGPAAATTPQTDQPAEVAATPDEDVPAVPERKKTRFSDRAATEAQTKAAAKLAKAKQKAAATPAPLTDAEIAAQKAQAAPLGLSGDTASKKKPKKVKGEKKERIQNKPPAPPAPKPEPTPIPPKSVRDNGEPVVTPAPSNLPPVTTPAPGAAVDTQPSTPSNPVPTPPPASTPPQ
jgi:peptidyl-prolyl cis-trans isomerase SurA